MPTTIRTPFVPSRHGFHFSNEFENVLVDVGGVRFATQGRCGGMAALALDYFNANVPIPNVTFVDHGLKFTSGPAVAMWPDGTVHVFANRTDGSTAFKRGTNLTARGGAGTFDNWDALSRDHALGEPAVCSWGPGRLDLFVRGDDKRLHHLYCEGGRWANDRRPCANLGFIEQLAGDDLSDPAASAAGAGNLDLFALRNGRLQASGWRNGWLPWMDRGAPPNLTLRGSPAAASQPGWSNAVVQASDGSVWHSQGRTGAQPTWTAMGGIATSSPALASPAQGRLEAYVVGTDGQLYVDVFANERWGGWSPLGSPPPGLANFRPSAVSAPGLMDVFVIAKDGMLWHRQSSGGVWHPWALADMKPTPQADRLTAAIYARLMETTIDPLVRAGAAALAGSSGGGIGGSLGATLGGLIAGGIAYAGLGSNQNNVSWLAMSADECFQRSYGEHLTRIRTALGRGHPIPLGLINPSGAVGHQVVAVEVNDGVMEPLGGDSRPGPYTFVKIYDNEYPGCDNMWLKYDAAARPSPRITQSNGACWKGAFARDDYNPRPPPAI